jgi:hypothetical protein
VRRAGDEELRERAVAQLEAGDLAQRLLAHDPGAVDRDGNQAAPLLRAWGGPGAAGLAEEEGAGAGGRCGGLSAAEEAGAVEMAARCGRLGLWGEARAVYDACAPRAASVARLQAALLARV